MAEPILCLVAFVLLLWIWLLKSRAEELVHENKRLRAQVADLNRAVTADVRVLGRERLEHPDQLNMQAGRSIVRSR